MTPFQTYGQTAAPSNMMFPTSSYLQAAQSAAETRLRGISDLSKNLSGGINSALVEYNKFKDIKSQINASQKSYETIKSFLPKDLKDKLDYEIDLINKDPNASLRDKAAFWDQTKNTLGGFINQGFAVEKIREEMKGREALLKAKQQEPVPYTPFNVGSPDSDLKNQYVGGILVPKREGVAYMPEEQNQQFEDQDVPYMIQRPTAQQEPMQQQPAGKLPKTRRNRKTGKMEFLNSQGTRYIEEPEDDLYFNPKTLGLEP